MLLVAFLGASLYLSYNARALPYLQVESNHASEIDEIFDDISYRKGASVIRMLGSDAFQVFSSAASI